MRLLFLNFLVAFFSLAPTAVFAQSSPSFEPVSLSLPILIGLGVIDALNPCVIGVLLLLLTVLMRSGNKKIVLRNGLAYTAGVYLTYLIGGLTFLAVFSVMRELGAISSLFYLVIGTLIIVAGTIEVKDYFWYGKWFSLSIPKRFVGTIERLVQTTHIGFVAPIFFGFIVTLVELPCTGAPYIAVLTLMSQSGFAYLKALPLLLLYNLVFVLPLLIIIGMAYYGVNLKYFHAWKKEKRGLMRLGIGLALWAVGVWIIGTVKEAWILGLTLGLVIFLVFMTFLKYFFRHNKK